MTVSIKCDFVVRDATENDMPRLYELEMLCAPHSRATKAQLRARLKKMPHGQLVIENDGTLFGVVYSQRIGSIDALAGQSAANVHQLHDEAGPIVQLLALHVAPEAEGTSAGDELLAFMLRQCRAMAGVSDIVAVVGCAQFDAAGARTFDDYIAQQGQEQDSLLAFHAAHGAKVLRALPQYRPKDVGNQGNGVLLAYEAAAPALQADSHLFVLSATNEERLLAYAGKVGAWLEAAVKPPRLADAIYTWQVGRTPMKWRLAIKAADGADLQKKLAQWLENQLPAPGIWSGKVKPRDAAAATLLDGGAGQQGIDKALADGDLDTLGAQWTLGAEIDWRQLHAASARKPRRVSVPIYPFAKDRHWCEDAIDEPAALAAPAPAIRSKLFVTPVWEAAPASQHPRPEGLVAVARHEVVLCDMADIDLQQLAALMPASTCSYALPAPVAEIGERYLAHAAAIFLKIKGILAENPRTTLVFQVVISDQPEAMLLAGLSGLLKSAGEENTNFVGQLIATSGKSPAVLAEQLLEEKARLDNGIVLYAEGGRQVMRWVSALPDAAVAGRQDLSFVDGGVYLVTGGLGGLGVMFMKEILRCAAKVKLIVTGRGKLSDANQAKLEQLADQGRQATIVYRQLDLNARAEVEALVASIVAEHGQLNGIFHAAGMVADNLSVNKSAAEFTGVLVPKVTGTLNLDAACRDVKLDFFLLFSSLCSFVGNAGQTDYAAANGFLDQFALYRNLQVANKERHGHTLSICWPLWEEGGMMVSAAVIEAVRRTTGLSPMRTATGLQVLHDSLAGPYGQTLIFEGDRTALERMLSDSLLTARAHSGRLVRAAAPEVAATLTSAVDPERLKEETLGKIKQMFAEITKRPAARIDVQEELSAYGIDSIIISNLNLGFSKVFGEISKTLFFELKTLADVAAYFLKEYPAQCLAWTGLAAPARQAQGAMAAGAAPSARASVDVPSAASSARLKEEMLKKIKQLFADITKRPAARIDVQEELSAYGIDSIIISNLNLGLSKVFGEISKTLFFELKTLEDAANYFLKEYPAQCLAWTELGGQPAGAASQAAPAAPDAARLREETLGKIKQLFADITKRPAARIDVQEELSAYGIDSIIISNLNLGLSKVFGEISKTLFFEMKTLEDAASYFLKEYPAQCAAWTGLAAQSAPAPAAAPAPAPTFRPVAAPVAATPGPAVAADGPPEPIAIVGISGIYPLAADIEQFWANLQAGRNCITEVPSDRWSLDDFYDADVDRAIEQGKSYGKWGGFIDQFAEFDPLFFTISPREAMNIDPQERLFLQECWRAMENAGYTRSDLKTKFRQKVGVFAGVTKPGYIIYTMHPTLVDEPFLPYTCFSSVANRVSYSLDITGPSMPVDTMCSSSLTAIHEASEYIRRGECEAAFAGGVNLYLHPYNYKMLSAQRMLSRDGACRSFGVGSNGYVPGEGVGVVMLKTLSSAIRDNDNIHGVILATHLNHGGKTNGYTIPNPRGQAELIRGAIDKAGIKASDISYIEAHGTGTELGDPIEISGLQQAFSPDSQDTGYCKIGSAKSNIGHLEAAAGIAGLTKVLLQMKHKQVAPSLHAERLNPNISFDKTAFRVNTSLTPWQPAQTAGCTSVARIAGISSFGAGGSNAHVIVREYLMPERASAEFARDEKIIIPLSARTAPQLDRRAADLLRFIRAATTPLDLTAMAHTLQLGREAMDERLTCLVSSVDQLAEKLQAYVDGKKDIEDVCRGQVSDNKDALHLFGDDEDFKETLDKWIARRKFSRLAELWARGMDFDWNKLYGQFRPTRMALPSYPFAKERFWVDTVVEMAYSPRKSGGSSMLHPLLHANTSDFSQQRFTSVFTGGEFFLRDHKVNGEKILPAVAYLEMARAAIALASPMSAADAVLELRNTTWAQAIVVTAPKEVNIALFADEADGQIEFEVRSIDAAVPAGSADVAQEALHCQGQAVFVRMDKPARVDIAQLKAAMTKGQEDVPGIYKNFLDMGVDFGAAHRAIDTVYLGEQQLLAKLILPTVVASTGDAYLLHPSLMDCALQSSLCLMDESVRRSRQPFLPFSLDTLRIVAPCTNEMFAWVRRAPSGNTAQGLVQFDVDLCDQLGNICVQLHGFTSRTTDAARKPAEQGAASGSAVSSAFSAPAPIVAIDPALPQLHCLVPVWNRVSPATAEAPTLPTAKILLVGGGQRALDWAHLAYPATQLLALPANASVASVQEHLKDVSFDHLLWLAPDVAQDETDGSEDDIVAAQTDGVLAVFRLAKALLNLEYGHNALRWTLITRNTQAVNEQDRIAPTHAALTGLVGSMAKEYPMWDLQLIDVDAIGSLAAGEALTRAADKQGNGLAYRHSEWFRQGLARAVGLPEALPAYRQGGVYVVIGGAGGLGEVWSRFMIGHCDARLVWIGRRAKDAAIDEKIRALGQIGRAPIYFSADATDADAMRKVHQDILAVYPAIHGVVHSAIDLLDQSIALMEETTFRAGLSAKLDVSVNLDMAFGDDDLDCMLYFSSLTSFSKAAGQSNYAAGCTFKDSYALSLAQRRPYPVKIMNWGYWGNVGVVTSAFYNKRMEQMGIGSIEAPEAMEALQILLGSELPQMALVKTLDEEVLAEIALPESVTYYPKQADSVLLQAVDAFHATFPVKSSAAIEHDLLSAETNALAGDILASVLAPLGLDDARVAPSAQGGHPLHDRWLRSSLDYLGQNTCRVMALDELWAQWEAKKSAWLINPSLRAQVALLEACLKALPDILTGKRAATDVMFPNSSMALVEGVYKGHALADYSNDVLGATLVAGIRRKLQVDSSAKIRIVEIGAGTGGTTARILPMLQEFSSVIAEYCYTDLSRAFLMHAEEQYQPKLPALTTAIFDVSKPSQSQTVAMNHYDFAVATNVLHATPDIRETLRNAKALLKNQGVLLLNEMCGWSLFSHLTFGLLEGWWLYEDAALRLPGSPGLPPEKWQAVLEEVGYESVAFLADDVHALGQQIIAAGSDGHVRQRIGKRPKAASVVAAKPDSAPPVVVVRSAPGAEGALREPCIAYLQGVVAKTLKLDAAQVSPGRSLTDYGLDSILVVGLTNQLRKSFPGITSTLFFEVQNIGGLADYLLENKKEHVLALLGTSAVAAPAAPTPAVPGPAGSQELAMPRSVRASRHQLAAASSGASSIVDVAIVGMSGRYPQAPDLESFWQNLSGGKNCVTEIPANRWNWNEYYDAEKGKIGKIYTKWGGFLDEIDCFDPLFFRISPKEAKIMDPQERLFLESCYHAIEDAGYTPETLGEIDKIGVFAGVMNARYNSQPLFYSIANRVSFVLNFQGPSMAVDTACSSSLTAIHLALDSIYSGMSECAIAGGVNLIIDPVHFLELSALTMLSDGNQCKSFGEGADGFVDAEGVGTVILKTLRKAEQDGDHIYGVIKASAVNAGGKTNGYTVPNPIAQAAVVSKALQRANMSASDISYIEAHGTGTALGDPIEIAGLKRAFEQFGKDKQFCAIGSLKSNIGHCESAAGIAALAKVLLQFKHKQLVPTLHADVSNHEIDFSQTPFKLQKSLTAWAKPRREKDGVVTELPRTAGISSFGAGGANAHLIVQEYEAPLSSAVVVRPAQVLIPLSARTADQLKQKIGELFNFVRAAARGGNAVDLHALAYTLQVGRETMEERVTFLVASIAQCEDKLGAYLDGKPAAEGDLRGRVKRIHEISDPAQLQAAANWAQEGDLAKLAQAWIGGVKVEWNKLYERVAKPHRISLPTYPFARERFWHERSELAAGAAIPLGVAQLHPLVHSNVSDIHQQCYRSSFDGSEFFVAEQRSGAAGGALQKVLPAMVYLEMARAAVEDATSSQPAKVRAHRTLELCNIVWADLAVLSGASEVSVALFAQPDDLLGYEIYSAAGDGAQEVIHCQGQAAWHAQLQAETLDIARLAAPMRQGSGDGAAHPGIKSRLLGAQQLLAELVMPAALAADAAVLNDGFVLHPLMLDAALQAAGELLGAPYQSALPLALASLHVFGACTKEMFAWVRHCPADGDALANPRLDIDLCDPHGKVCVALRGLMYENEGRGEIEKTSALTNPVASPAASARAPALVLGDVGVVLDQPQAQTFTSGVAAKPTQISLTMDI